MWTSFPDHIQYPTMGALYRHLGGVAEQNIPQRGFGENGNACASRMSVAMNKGGAPINYARAQGARARSIGAADRSRIIYGVADLKRYLIATLGQPPLDGVIPFDSAFRGKSGIIAFGVTGWDNAVGHIALFNGATYREPAYDNYATFSDGSARTVSGQFWEIR